MFDLNAAISAWRRRFAQRADLGPDDLDELEDHLREAVAELEARGLQQEEAFLIAARRLGDADALGAEFAIANPSRRRSLRMRWLTIGGVVTLLLLVVGALAAQLTRFGSAAPDFEPPIFTSTFLLHLIIQLTVVAVGGLLIWRVLAGDRAAHRIQRGGLPWILRVVAVVALGGPAIVLLLALLTRGGAWLLSGHGLAGQPVAMHLMLLWPPLLLLMVPVGLLLLVWWLTEKR